MKIFFNQLYNYIIFLNTILFCVFPKFVTLTIILLFCISLYGLITKKLTFKFNLILVLFILFYLFYLFYTFFTFNNYLSNLYIVNKLPFLIFPLIFLFKSNDIDINIIKYSSFGLIIGVLLVSFLSFYNSFEIYFETNSLFDSFTSTNFSYIHHPSYYSVYCLFVIFITIYAYKKQWKYFNIINTIIIISISVVSIILSKSFASYSFIALIMIYLFINKVISYKKIKYSSKYILIFTIIFFLTLIYIFKFNLNMQSELGQTVNSLKYFYSNPIRYCREHPGYKTGNQVRLIMWTATILEINEHKLGVGTGNVDYFLSKRLKKLNQHEMAKLDDKKQILFNPHNQFLQTCLEIGFFGLSIFLLLCFISIKSALKDNNYFLLLIVVSLIFNSFFESMLQRQSGIIFYSYWICILSTYSFSSKLNKNENTIPDAILST